MKDHILAALREQFEDWEKLLTSLSDEQLMIPEFDDNWSVKDMVAHLWGWQQISSARMAAAVLNREPEYPAWVTVLAPGWEENPDRTNSSIYETCHTMPWSAVHQQWRAGFLYLLELGELVPERELLDGDRYPWLKGYSLAFILVASYEHHQEHLDNLFARLRGA